MKKVRLTPQRRWQVITYAPLILALVVLVGWTIFDAETVKTRGVEVLIPLLFAPGIFWLIWRTNKLL